MSIAEIKCTRKIIRNIKSIENISTNILRLENGYEIDGKSKKSIHRIIYEKHYGCIPIGYVIHHINGIKIDNKLENLIQLPKEYHNLLHQKFHIKNLPSRNFIEIDVKHWLELKEKYDSIALDIKNLIQKREKIRISLGISSKKNKKKFKKKMKKLRKL